MFDVLLGEVIVQHLDRPCFNLVPGGGLPCSQQKTSCLELLVYRKWE